MKRTGYIYPKICDLDNIESAILNASKGKRHQAIVNRILSDKTKYAKHIQSILVNKTYKPSPYQTIELFDGATKKRRIISKPKFYPDQVIHWAMMLQLQPIIMKNTYHFNCGSIPKRGTSYGQKAIRKWLDNQPKKTKYCLKMDISKYYPSIDNKLMKASFRKKIKDSDCLWLIDQIVDSAQGLPIGNYTSQWFANFFLNDLDHFIKSLDGAKHYIRYVDDMVIFGSNKRKLHKIKVLIEKFLESKHLKLKSNWQVFPIDKRPLDFLGLKFYRNHTTLRRKNSLRIRRRMKRIAKKGSINYVDACAVISYWGWIKRSDSYHFYHQKIKSKVSVSNARKAVSKHAKTHNLRTDANVR